MKIWLIDTGPLVAYIDRADPMHETVATALDDFSGQLVTTGAVITETMHMLSEDDRGPVVFAEFIIAAGLQIFEMAEPSRILEAARLMQKYSDTPMDFADATLVLLANALAVPEILTLDRRGFKTYRMLRRKPFHLILDQS